MARTAYEARCAEIRRALPASTREFADAMSDACAEYEAAMVADLGPARARRLGAFAPSLRGAR